MDLSREALRAYSNRRVKKFTAEGIGDFWVCGMTERERAEDEYTLAKAAEKTDEKEVWVRVRARMIQRCLCNAEGKRLYTDSKADLDEILSLDSNVTNVIADAIEQHSGRVRAVEDVAKN